METFSALLALYAGNSPVTGEFPSQRPVTRSFGVFFDLCLNKRLSKQSRGWWFETPSRSPWRHCNVGPTRWVDRSDKKNSTNRGAYLSGRSSHHDDVIKWKYFPRYWPFVRKIHRAPVNSPRKGQWRGALMLSLICYRINGWVNNRESGDLRRHRTHYDVTVVSITILIGDGAAFVNKALTILVSIKIMATRIPSPKIPNMTSNNPQKILSTAKSAAVNAQVLATIWMIIMMSRYIKPYH